MTSQTKHFIELSDITALRCECQRCHTTLTIPVLEKIKTDKIRTCPNCNEPWAANDSGTIIELSIKEFIDSLQQLSGALQGWRQVVPVGFQISLELKSDVVVSKDKA
jgi:NAD-dependent SIR2 family protein deacetylase